MMGVTFIKEEEAMSAAGENISMFGKMAKHDEMLDDHDKRLDEHSIQLKVQAEQIKQLQDNYLKLENVVMSESRETRAVVTQTNNQLQDVIKGLMGYNTGNNQLANSLKIARLESYAKIVGILAGSGGILYYIFN